MAIVPVPQQNNLNGLLVPAGTLGFSPVSLMDYVALISPSVYLNPHARKRNLNYPERKRNK